MVNIWGMAEGFSQREAGGRKSKEWGECPFRKKQGLIMYGRFLENGWVFGDLYLYPPIESCASGGIPPPWRIYIALWLIDCVGNVSKKV